MARPEDVVEVRTGRGRRSRLYIPCKLFKGIRLHTPAAEITLHLDDGRSNLNIDPPPVSEWRLQMHNFDVALIELERCA